ncbi:MAG: drug/metabolite transporter (DMT)-like permease [Parasphingorhabdus sp.]|jgi:drug/metabolite transporter (DMT)-like permease
MTRSGRSQVPASVLALAAWLIVPIMDGIAKYLGDFLPVVQIVWARFFFHFIWVTPLMLWRHGPTGFITPRPRLQIGRGVFLLCATSCFFTGIRYIPLADAVAIVFVAPLLVLLFSSIWLREKIGWLQIAGVVSGLIGVLIIQRPGFEEFHWASLLMLATAVFFAAFIVSTRALAGSAPQLVTLVYQSIMGLVLSSVLVPFFWVSPTPQHWILMICIGPIAATTHLLLIKAHERGEASKLAPIAYSEIIMALIIGYFVFGDFPDFWTGIGASIIITVSFLVTWPGARRRQTASSGRN